MLTASAQTIAATITGTVLTGDSGTTGNGLVVDSRAAVPGCIFVALPGDSSDGHDFLNAALDSGARVLIVTRSLDELADVPDHARRRSAVIIKVASGLGAIQDLAAWHRNRLHARVIGVTGSTGKTTTKDFLTAILRPSLRVVATEGNRNNELGMPLTILGAGSETDALVLEMGMRGIGQIAHLAEIARPDIGLVTNVGTSHVELLGTQDAIAAAKGELVRAIPSEGTVFLNGDDPYSEYLAHDASATIVTYGLRDACDVRAEHVTVDELSRASFTLVSEGVCAEVTLPLPGRHNVYNALAAAAVGLGAGIQPEAIAEALGSARVAAMRMETFVTASGVTVVNDAYNANPSSMRAAVDTLADIDASGQRVAVLGDMAELGSLTELAHFELGEHLATLPIDVLVTVGERARRIAEGAKAAGMDGESVRPCADAVEASEVLDDTLEAGDVILVKASRVMGLERIVEGIVNPRVG